MKTYFRGDFKKTRTFNKSGQVTVEYILLAVGLLFIFQVASNSLKGSAAVREFQEKPRSIFKSMVENGNWESEEDNSRKQHPNHSEFQYSPDGDGA